MADAAYCHRAIPAFPQPLTGLGKPVTLPVMPQLP